MTLPTPPALARALLERSLADDPAGPAILGDLHEDFVHIARVRGLLAARMWYAGQALLLALGLYAGRLTQRGRRPGPRGVARPGSAALGLPGELAADLRYALRTLRHAPGFALFTALVIGLGVGATTSVFSVLEPLILAPLPFEDADRLVWIANEAPPEAQASLSWITSRAGNLRDFRSRAQSFEGITGYNAFAGAYTLTGAGNPERAMAAEVAHDFVDVLGIVPRVGRGFTDAEGAWGGPRAVLLGHGFWERRFGSDAGVIGSTLTLNGEPHEVIGVLPASFDFASVFTPGERVDVLVPFPVSDETDARGNTMFFIGRLRDGVGPDAAQAELDAIVAALEAEQPDRWGLGADLEPLREHVAGPFRPALMLLAAAAGTLLLIVCVNVSNVVLARAPGRARELAVRKALGASRGRVVRQLLLEMVMISLAGAALGVSVASGATHLVASGASIGIPLLEGVRADAQVLFFAVGVAAATGVVVGLLPALQISEGGEASVLREGGRGSSAARGATRMREALVVSQIALACVLLVTASLLVRSFRKVLDVDLGFEPANLVVWEIGPSRTFETHSEASAYYTALVHRVSEVPGVEALGLTDALPLRHNRQWGLSVVGRPDDDEGRFGFFPHVGDWRYRAAMGIALVAGRDLGPDDTFESQPVVLVNESGARRLFPAEDPLGQRVTGFWPDVEWEVVGVLADVHQLGPEVRPGVQVYFAYPQQPDFSTADMVVRSRRPTEELAGAVAGAMREVDPALPTGEYWTMEALVQGATYARRFTLGILTAFGLSALVLAGLGIYGVLAHTVAERTPEIGIRMALGASTTRVLRGVLRRMLALAILGIAVGAALSLATTRLVTALLYGVGANDPASYASGALALLLVAALGSALPAVRAARTTGLKALRAE